MEEFFSQFQTCARKQKQFLQKFGGPDSITQESDLDPNKCYLKISHTGLLDDVMGMPMAVVGDSYSEATPQLVREWQDSTRNCTFPKRDVYGAAICHKMAINDKSRNKNGLVYRARFIRWNNRSQSWQKEIH
jgi:hypothetical protein